MMDFGIGFRDGAEAGPTIGDRSAVVPDWEWVDRAQWECPHGSDSIARGLEVWHVTAG